MKREIMEQIEFTGEEKDAFDFIRNMLANLCDDIKKEDAFPTLSDLYIDTEHLLGYMNAYIQRYYKF